MNTVTIKNRYEYRWYLPLETIAITPIAFSVFPVPLAIPVYFVSELNIWANVVFFGWLIFGGAFIYYMEKKHP